MMWDVETFDAACDLIDQEEKTRWTLEAQTS